MSNEFQMEFGRTTKLYMYCNVDDIELCLEKYNSDDDVSRSVYMDIRQAKALSAARTSFIGKLEQEAGIVGEHTELP